MSPFQKLIAFKKELVKKDIYVFECPRCQWPLLLNSKNCGCCGFTNPYSSMVPALDPRVESQVEKSLAELGKEMYPDRDPRAYS